MVFVVATPIHSVVALSLYPVVALSCCSCRCLESLKPSYTAPNHSGPVSCMPWYCTCLIPRFTRVVVQVVDIPVTSGLHVVSLLFREPLVSSCCSTSSRSLVSSCCSTSSLVVRLRVARSDRSTALLLFLFDVPVLRLPSSFGIDRMPVLSVSIVCTGNLL